jgi:catechol 2,3-dioxygenase
MSSERIRDIAHLSSVELFTPKLEETTDFFVQLMSLEVVEKRDGINYLRTWDDYEKFSIKVVQSETSGIGACWFRTTSAEALQRIVERSEELRVKGAWIEGECGKGKSYSTLDPDGHRLNFYWDTDYFVPTGDQVPSLKNQASAFPGRGANVRRLDHVNFLASNVEENSEFMIGLLGGRVSEQIQLPDGKIAASWLTFTNKSYDVVYTSDWTGTKGRLHHIAFATDTREDILRAADVFLENDIFIETGPHKHAIQQTFFLYVYEPGGNRIELCNAGARLLLSPDAPTVSWTLEERSKGQAWGLKTIESFHTHGTPPAGENHV